MLFYVLIYYLNFFKGWDVSTYIAQRWRTNEDAFICFLQSAEESVDLTLISNLYKQCRKKNCMKDVQFSLGKLEFSEMRNAVCIPCMC